MLRLSLVAVLGLLAAVASPVAALNSGERAQQSRCTDSVAPRHLPGPGFKLASLPLAGGLLITGPPRKSYTQVF